MNPGGARPSRSGPTARNAKAASPFSPHGLQGPRLYQRACPPRHAGGLSVDQRAAWAVEDALDHPRRDVGSDLVRDYPFMSIKQCRYLELYPSIPQVF